MGCFLLLSGLALAEERYCTPAGSHTGSPVIGKIISSSAATVTHEGGEARSAVPDDCLYFDSSLVTDRTGRLAIEIRDPGDDKAQPASVINLGPSSDLTLRRDRKEADWVLELLDGWFRFFSGREVDLDVDTPYVTAGVRGTEFALYTDDAACEYYQQAGSRGCSILWVQAGSVEATLSRLTESDNEKIEASKIDVVGGVEGSTAGDTVVAVAGESLRFEALEIKPDDAVNWVLYYPPLVRYETQSCAEIPAQSGSPAPVDALRCASPAEFTDTVERYLAQSIPADDPLLTQAAIRLLSQGDAIRARALLAKATGVNGLALRGLVALKDNDKAEARKLAARALDIDGDSANAHLVMSYVLQALFDLEGAADETAIAARLAPEDALILARQAELQLALQDVSGALGLASQAVVKAEALNPDTRCRATPIPPGSLSRDPTLSRAYAVQGYVELVNLDAEKALTSFERARCADDLSPLAYLGLGLAGIREGRLEEGVRQLELAVALDPKVSLYRSYLGKGYFEQKLPDLAEQQFDIAKRLDVNDPTPWLYESYLKRAQNDPIGALAAIEKSKERNKYRAVYRSKFLLDSDDAVRSVSQGRIYEELGFERLTIPLISESLATDPKNHSAHRALADVYRDRPRHDIARVSETLQAQVRQPLALAAADPRLVDSRLFDSYTISALRPSYAEYTRLFTGEGVAGTWGTQTGSNNLYENQIITSILFGRASFNVSYFALDTDGYRDNNYRNQDYWNAFFQYQVLPGTQVQFEYRTIKDEFGDPLIRFDMDQFFIATDTTLDIESWRASVHHALNAQWDITALVREETADRKLEWQAGVFSRNVEEDGRQFELQLTGDLSMLSLVAGASYFDGDRLNEARFSFPLSLFFPAYIRKSTPEHFNIYAYSNVSSTEENGFITLGASYDQVRDGITDDNQYELNPKVGAVWKVASLPNEPTIRVAYFETLKRALLANQTLEPTTIAGFSQFYDDGEGARTKVKAAAVDVPLPMLNVDLGIEWTERDINVPILDFAALSVSRHDVSESSFGAYAYWHNGNNLGVGLSYQHEEYDRGVSAFGPEGIVDMEIDRVELHLNYSLDLERLDNRLTISVVPQWLRQNGVFVDASESPLPREGSDGYIVDVAVKYPLPARSGHVALAVENLFDRRFNFQDTDPFNPDVSPERVISLVGVFNVDI